MIEYDLETYPLQVKTTTQFEEKNKMSFVMLTVENERIGSSDFAIMLQSGVFWWYLKDCSGDFVGFTGNIPPEDNKIWTFTKTANSLKVECNELEVLNLVFSDKGQDCSQSADNKAAAKIQFWGIDTVSDSYRAKGTLSLHASSHIEHIVI